MRVEEERDRERKLMGLLFINNGGRRELKLKKKKKYKLFPSRGGKREEVRRYWVTDAKPKATSTSTLKETSSIEC